MVYSSLYCLCLSKKYNISQSMSMTMSMDYVYDYATMTMTSITIQSYRHSSTGIAQPAVYKIDLRALVIVIVIDIVNFI